MRIDAKKCTITVSDGAATPNTATIKLGDGDVNWNEHAAREYLLDRGKLDSVRDGDEAPVDLTIDSVFEFYTGNFLEILKGKQTGAVSVDTDSCQPYACKVTIVHDPQCATSQVETFVFDKFRWEEAQLSVKNATINVSGKCNILEPTVSKT